MFPCRPEQWHLTLGSLTTIRPTKIFRIVAEKSGYSTADAEKHTTHTRGRDMTLLSIADKYGSVDLTRTRLSRRYRHVPGNRLSQLCERLGIACADAVVEWSGSWSRGRSPTKDGVVVSARSADKLLAAIEERERRNAPKREAAKKKALAKRRAERQELAEAGIYDHDSRTAQAYLNGDIDEYEAQLIQFKAGYRHEHTNYEAWLEHEDRDSARELCQDQPIPDEWRRYLAKYDFPYPEVAERLSCVLESPEQAHPAWFCEAVLAVVQQGGCLEPWSYERVQEAVSEWRRVRSYARC